MFGSAPTKRSGRHSWCKACLSAGYKEYKARSGERVRESQRRYKKDNREKINATAKGWRERNPEKATAIQQRRRERHPERIAASKRRSVEKKPDLYREISRIAEQRRRQRKADAQGGGVTKEQWLRQAEPYGNRCAYCDMVTTTLVMEHMVPLARGGDHDICNVIPACRRCNSRKHTMTALEFFIGRRLDRKVG